MVGEGRRWGGAERGTARWGGNEGAGVESSWTWNPKLWALGMEPRFPEGLTASSGKEEVK